MAKNELIEAGKEISIDALDTAISNLTDFFKGFPVISSAITLLKALASIPDRLYVKKMYYFLSALKNDDMDSDTFSDAMNKLNKDETKFEETLLFIIEKAENTEKAHVLGYFTRLLALGIINYNDYLFHANVINNIQLIFLKCISREYKNSKNLENSIIFGVLQSQGFVESGNGMHEKNGTLNLETKFSVKLSEFGSILDQYFKDSAGVAGSA